MRATNRSFYITCLGNMFGVIVFVKAEARDGYPGRHIVRLRRTEAVVENWLHSGAPVLRRTSSVFRGWHRYSTALSHVWSSEGANL